MKDECTDSFFHGDNNTDKRQDGINILSSGARLLIFMNQGYYPYGRRVNNLGDYVVINDYYIQLSKQMVLFASLV